MRLFAEEILDSGEVEIKFHARELEIRRRFNTTNLMNMRHKSDEYYEAAPVAIYGEKFAEEWRHKY